MVPIKNEDIYHLDKINATKRRCREELVQVAAVALAAIECFDRNEKLT